MGTTKLVKSTKPVHKPWMYQGQPVLDIPAGAFGFIYQIHYLGKNRMANGCHTYIGRKQFIQTRNKPLPKSKQVTVRGKPRKNLLRKTKVDSDSWRTYFGSNKLLKELASLEPPELFQREILRFTYSKRETTYYEDKYLFSLNVLEQPGFFNDQIAGSHYKKHLAHLFV